MTESFGHFELLERVSTGRVSERWVARSAEVDGQFWLERVHPSVAALPGFRDTFFSDLEQAKALEHPGALKILAVGEVEGRPWFTTEIFEAERLSTLLSQRPLPATVAVALMRPVVEALAAAHARTPALLHRDVSSPQVLVSGDGQVRLAGFGFVRARLSAGEHAVAVSPEQARGQRPNERSDVFAAAVLLHQLACGRGPVPGGEAALLAALAVGELEAPRAVNPSLVEPLATLLERALDLGASPTRLTTSQALLEALDAAAAQLPPGPSVTEWRVSLVDAATPMLLPTVQPEPKPPSPDEAPVTMKLEAFAPPKPRTAPSRWAVRAGLAVAAVLTLSVGVFRAARGHDVRPSVDESDPELITTRIDSEPRGAMVYLDSQLAPQRTPLTVTLKRSQRYVLELRSARGGRAYTALIQAQRELLVRLTDGEVLRDDRYGEGPPQKKEAGPATSAPATDSAPVDTTPPATPPLPTGRTVQHSAKGPNVNFELMHEHEVVVPDEVCRASKPARRELDVGALANTVATPVPMTALQLDADGRLAVNSGPTGAGVCSFVPFVRSAGQTGALPAWAVDATKAAFTLDDLDPNDTLMISRGTITSVTDTRATVVMLAWHTNGTISTHLLGLTTERVSGAWRLAFFIPARVKHDVVAPVSVRSMMHSGRYDSLRSLDREAYEQMKRYGGTRKR